jgi:serine protease Do
MNRAILIFIAVAFMAIPALAQDAGWIGITIEDQGNGGAVIRRVQPNSPAEKAGLKEGDVVQEFNKEAVIGVQQLTRLVRETPVGRSVDVKIRRDNREQTIKVTTERASGPRQFNFTVPGVHVFSEPSVIELPRVQVSTVYTQAGIRVEDLTDQLRAFFGVNNGGVLVTSVEQGSAGEKAGLKAGDVITSLDGKTIRTPGDFSRELRAARSKGTFKVFRDKQEREIKLD